MDNRTTESEDVSKLPTNVEKAILEYFAFPENNAGIEEPYVEKTLEELGFGRDSTTVTLTNPQDPADAISEFLKTGHEGSATVRVAAKTFKVHMMLLRAYSKYFIKCNPCMEIVLPEDKVSADAFEAIYEWLLHQKDFLNIDNFLDILLASEFLEMREVSDECWAFIEHKENMTTNFIFKSFAEAKSRDILPHLREALLSRMGKSFLQFVASDLFLHLTVPEIQSLFISNGIGVYTEMEVLLAALHWFDFDIEERKQHAGAVMKCVRFNLLSALQVGTLFQQFKFESASQIFQDANVKSLVYNSLSDHIDEGKIKIPGAIQERKWIIDPQCQYHRKTNTLDDIFISYDKFLQYLKYLREQSLDHSNNFQSAPKLFAEPESPPNYQN